MPRRTSLSPEEVQTLEEWLRERLVPVSPDPQFVGRTQSRLQDPRAVQVPMKAPASLRQSLVAITSLSGALLALALVISWMFWRRSHQNELLLFSLGNCRHDGRIPANRRANEGQTCCRRG